MRTAAKLLQHFLTGIGALYVIVTFTPLDNWWTNRLCGPIDDPKGDVLILLGAETFPDAMGYETYMRAVYGVRVWREGGFRQVFISGGRGPDGTPVSVPMRDYMIASGVPASAVTVETMSTSTHENALFTKQALQNTPGRLVLLTSDYHTFRAWHAFRKAGLNVQECSFPDLYKLISRRSNRWGVFLGLCRETTAIAYYWARGWI